MRIANFCFIAAAVAALCGMSLGIFMGIRGDFTLVPVHAHINLLGWVSLALYGLYHRGVARPDNRLAWAQVGCAALAVPVMTGALAALLLTGSERFVSLAILGSLLAVAGMLLFLASVIADMRAAAVATGGLRSRAAREAASLHPRRRAA